MFIWKPLPLLTLLSACLALPAGAADILLITRGSSPTTQESLRVSQFESWGHTVTTLDATSTQAEYDTALASADLAWVTEEVLSSDVSYKLRETSVGVVCGEIALDSEMGFSTSDGFEESSTNQIFVTSNSHSVSSGLSTGFITIFSSNQPRSLANSTAASGLTVLATSSSSDPALAVLEPGATLANTYNGNATASGRRVRLPWGGTSFDWSSLDSDGLLIAQQAIDWAAYGSSGPLAYWKFDETSGSTAVDSSGNGHDGSYDNGVTLTETGVRGYASRFDGSNDVVTVPGSSALNLSGSMSVGCWVKSEVSSWNAPACLVSKRSQFIIHPQAGTTNIHFYAHLDGNWQYVTVDVGKIDRWRHYVGVYDQTTGDLKFYVDGELKGTENFGAGAALTSDNGNLTIGQDDGNASRTLNGCIDDVVLYDRVMTDEEIAEHYGLMGHWRLDETSGTVAADDSIAARDGAHTGSSTLGVEAIRSLGVELNTSGTGDRIDLPHTAVDGLSSVSVAWWMRTDNTGQTTVLSGARSSQANAFLLYFSSDSNFRPFVDGSSRDYSVEPISNGSWRHYVYQLDRTSGAESLHVNGELAASGSRTATSSVLDVDSGGLMLAQEQDSLGGGFSSSQVLSGDLDDVRIYSRKLGDSEIAELYGLVGHWKLDEGGGSIAADSTPFGNDGALTGDATWNTEDGITAIDLDGSGDYISLGNPDHLNFEGPITLAAWIRASDYPSSFGNILAHGHQTSPNREVQLRVQSGTDYRTGSWSPEEGAAASIPSNDRGSWVHVIGMYDGSDWRIYRNGVLEATTAGPNGSVLADNTEWAIGASGGGGRFFNGEIRDARIYNRAATAREIAEMYGLVGWWRMEETSGTDVADSSGAGNHGTIAGSATWSTDAKEGDGSLTLDGADYVEIPSSIVDGENGVTLAGWARLTDTGSNGAVLIDIGNLFGITLDHADTAKGTNTYSYTGSSFEFLSSAAYYEDTGWRHFATVFNADSQQTELYVDGVLQGTRSLAGPVAFDLAVNRTKLGDYGSGSSWRLTGGLDDMRVYNRALTSDEIRELAGGGSATGVRIVRWLEVATP